MFYKKNYCSTLPDSREEEKKISYIDIKGSKYRVIYVKTRGDMVTKNVLRVEIPKSLDDIAGYIKMILDTRHYSHIHIFILYKEFLGLKRYLENIDRNISSSGYDIIFAFIPKDYEEDDYILLYDIYRKPNSLSC